MRPRFAIFALLCLGLSGATISGTPASAQGFFDMLFSGDRYAPRQRQYVPQQANAYADPSNPLAQEQQRGYGAPAASTGGTGRYVAYCVRLCDGRYFPMQRHGNATSVQLCSAFCPAAKTQVFNGSQIDHAVASSGARYADLDNAFVYRERIVDNCTCNGRNSFGLAPIDVASDPTLRQGDIVATGDNVKAALIAMAASKERAAVREATNERPALRGSASRRAAAAPQPVEALPED